MTKLKYTTVVRENHRDEEYERYELENTEDVCSELESTLGDSIFFGGQYGDKINCTIAEFRSYPNGETNEYHSEIKYCPFCGDEIDYEEVDKVKIVEEEEKVEQTRTKRKRVSYDEDE